MMSDKDGGSDDVPNVAKGLRGKSLGGRFAVGFGALALILAVVAGWVVPQWRLALVGVGGLDTTPILDFAIAHAKWGTYWGCLINAGIAAVLALTTRWWADGLVAQPAPLRVPLGRRGWLWLLLILAGAGALRWARLDVSLYNDEAHNFKRYFAGYYLAKADGTVRWRVVRWPETLWLNKVGNNSTPYSAAAKAAHDWALRETKAPKGAVIETALRFPAWMAGMLSLVVMWAFMRRLLPGTMACWWILLLGALHPWHVRYSSEARGYAFMLLGISLCLYCAHRAWTENRWRWWLAMGAAQAFAVWSFSGTAYYLVAFNGLLLLTRLWLGVRDKSLQNHLAGPVVGMTAGGMLVILVMLPMIPQLLGALSNNVSAKGVMGLSWWLDVASTFVAGVRWGEGGIGNVVNPSTSRYLDSAPVLWGLVFVALGIFAVGAWRLWRMGPFARIVIFAGPAAIFLAWASLSQSGNYLHFWYLLHALPGWLAVFAAAGAFSTRSGDRGGWAWVPTAALVPLLGAWLWIDTQLLDVSKENLRGVAEAVPAGSLHATAYSDVDIYDPEVIPLDGVAKLNSVIARAAEQRKPLYVSFSRKIPYPPLDEMLDLIETSDNWEKVTTFYGLEEGQFTHHLYKFQK